MDSNENSVAVSHSEILGIIECISGVRDRDAIAAALDSRSVTESGSTRWRIVRLRDNEHEFHWCMGPLEPRKSIILN